MILETLAGSALGFVGRFAPELLKFFDQKDERKHELARLDKELAADRQRAELNIRAIETQGAADATAGDIALLAEALRAQAAPTGVKWVDALNAFVRPFLTLYWCVVLYTAVLIARLVILLGQGVPAADALVSLWGPNEVALVAAMMAYWFADRSLRKGGGVGAAH